MSEGYKGLQVWQLAMEIVVDVYRVTESFPQSERYGLISQLRRAAVSIPSNIAESQARGSTRDFIRFLSVASGSRTEVETQLEIARRLDMAKGDELERVVSRLDELGRMLTRLRQALGRRLEEEGGADRLREDGPEYGN